MTSPRSGFQHITAVAAPKPRRLAWLAGALDGVAFSLPVTLGSASLVFIQIDPRLLGYGVFASLLGLALLHLLTAFAQRPVLYAGRFFEASTLAAMMSQVPPQLPGWGLADHAGTRLAILCMIGAATGIVIFLLYLARADRFTRYIPAPVFAGIATGTAFVMFIGQTRSLAALADGSNTALLLSVSAAAALTAYAVRVLRPRLPATAIGLAAGAAVGWAWWLAGHPSLMVAETASLAAFPFTLADWQALRSAAVQWRPLLTELIGDAAILGTMVFVNTTLSAQSMTQVDDRQARNLNGRLLGALGVAVAGLAGSTAISGSQTASEAAARHDELGPRVMLASGLLVCAMLLSGALALLPVAALTGALLCEAWFMVDRSSAHTMRELVRGKQGSANSREDLALVAAVTVSALLMNMVAAVFVALLLGLTQFAARNSRRPVRHVWTGSEVHSQCARPQRDLALLSQHAGDIKVFQLEGDLFFGAAFTLAATVERQMMSARHVVFDWSRVHHVDSSLALTIRRVQKRAQLRAIQVVHAGTQLQGGNVAQTLQQAIPDAHIEPDLDRALEHVENQVIRQHGPLREEIATTQLEDAPLFEGLTSAQRQLLQAKLPQRFYRKGDVLFRAGEPSDSLMLVLHGQCSIVVTTPEGHELRVAGVRRGATLGEMGFLDGSPRSASVVAGEDTTVGVLTRDAFAQLDAADPAIVHCILKNLALDLAARLRRANKLASVRAAAGGG